MSAQKNRRILIIDDTPAIHQDFRKVLAPSSLASQALDAQEQALFGDRPPRPDVERGYEVDSALQGREGLDMVLRARAAHRPYALVLADMRMPPGWDGVETLARILEATPAVEVCICSAYSDYSWHDVIRRVRKSALRLLRKPFETREVLAAAAELTEKWNRLNGEAR